MGAEADGSRTRRLTGLPAVAVPEPARAAHNPSVPAQIVRHSESLVTPMG